MPRQVIRKELAYLTLPRAVVQALEELRSDGDLVDMLRVRGVEHALREYAWSVRPPHEKPGVLFQELLAFRELVERRLLAGSKTISRELLLLHIDRLLKDAEGSVFDLPPLVVEPAVSAELDPNQPVRDQLERARAMGHGMYRAASTQPALADAIDTRGLFAKYIVHRTDGSDAPGRKHHGCWYFVLDPAHDSHARVALAAYASDCATLRPELSRDLRAKLTEFAVAPPAPVGGGVTEAMLDDLWRRLPAFFDAEAVVVLDQWRQEARAAIRAQKQQLSDKSKQVAELEKNVRHLRDERGKLAARADGATAYKRRAEAAERRVAELELLVGSSGDTIRRNIESYEKRVRELEAERDGWKGDAEQRAQNAEHHKRAADSANARADAAEAQLAELGTNPLRRDLVERHLANAPLGSPARGVCAAILLNQEPERFS